METTLLYAQQAHSGSWVVAQFCLCKLFSSYCIPPFLFHSEQETGSQSAVRVCIDISFLPQDMRSVLRLHTHLSMLTPSRTDIFPSLLRLSPPNPFSGFPPCSHSLSLSCSSSHSSVITVDLHLGMSKLTHSHLLCLRHWQLLITREPKRYKCLSHRTESSSRLLLSVTFTLGVAPVVYT